MRLFARFVYSFGVLFLFVNLRMTYEHVVQIVSVLHTRLTWLNWSHLISLRLATRMDERLFLRLLTNSVYLITLKMLLHRRHLILNRIKQLRLTWNIVLWAILVRLLILDPLDIQALPQLDFELGLGPPVMSLILFETAATHLLLNVQTSGIVMNQSDLVFLNLKLLNVIKMLAWSPLPRWIAKRHVTDGEDRWDVSTVGEWLFMTLGDLIN